MAKLAAGNMSLKRIGVDKTNARIILIISGATFLVVFFLVASYSLFNTLSYQNRIIKAKKQAVSQLKENLTARDSLVSSYKTFVDAPVNYIGGSATGSGAQDGNNAKIVLDALPGTYDFPALTASLEKIASDQKVKIQQMMGTDEALTQQKQDTSKPTPIEMPFEISVTGDYTSVQHFVDAFNRSIRPIQVQSMEITGDSKEVTLNLKAKSYYQPGKTLDIHKKVIK